MAQGSRLMLRREMLTAMAALAALPSVAWGEEPGLQTGDAAPFDGQAVINRARALAVKPYAARPMIPQEWRDLTYDQYRQIWFDARNALWENSTTPQRVDVFAPGLYFPRGVETHVVEDGTARAVGFDMGVFDTTDQLPDLPVDDTLGYSGLRLRAELEKAGIFQEYAVFQGASYFRGIGTGQNYGLSARGLALKTGDPMGEEFPDFIAFWLETPAKGAKNIVLHALLDSPSCTGAYRFDIAHGDTLHMQVSAQIFARTDMTHIGIAPLTSMFLFDETDRQRFDDFRPNVHDSDGLAIHNGAGEVIWRPLSNPTSLQVSAFADRDPKGFGLLQRTRDLGKFNDLEAHYHNRPSLWVTPNEGWGRGSVSLVEIPADLEIYDNIVAYWRPSETLRAGETHHMSYALDWGENPVPNSGAMQVINTSAGARPEGGRIFAIDFAPDARLPDDLSKLTKIIRASAGEVSDGVLQRNPDSGGVRLAFTFYAGDARLVEFRAQLRLDGAPLSEVWLYRWTAST